MYGGTITSCEYMLVWQKTSEEGVDGCEIALGVEHTIRELFRRGVLFPRGSANAGIQTNVGERLRML
jgi:hypothetical protein